MWSVTPIVFGPTLVAFFASLCVICEGVQRPKHIRNSSGVEAAVQLVSKYGTEREDPHVIVSEKRTKTKKPRTSLVVKHSSSLSEDNEPKTALLIALKELGKDRKQLESNDALLQQDVQRAANQVQTAADQLQHASQLFLAEKAELMKASEDSKANLSLLEAERDSLKLDVGKLLHERGRFADEARKGSSKNQIKSAKSQHKLEMDQGRLLKSIKTLQDSVYGITKERDAALQETARTKEAMAEGAKRALAEEETLKGTLQKSTAARNREVQELEYKSRHEYNVERDASVRRNMAMANYWKTNASAMEKELQNATRMADTLMTGAKMLYKANKMLKARLQKATTERSELQVDHEQLEKRVYDETNWKNVNAWYAQQIAAAAQEGADKLLEEKRYLNAQLGKLTQEHEKLQNYSEKLRKKLHESHTEGTMTKAQAGELYAQLEGWKKNASMLEIKRVELTNQTTQLLEGQKMMKQELDDARRTLHELAPWAKFDQPGIEPPHTMSQEIERAIGRKAQEQAYKTLSTEKAQLEGKVQELAAAKDKLSADQEHKEENAAALERLSTEKKTLEDAVNQISGQRDQLFGQLQTAKKENDEMHSKEAAMFAEYSEKEKKFREGLEMTAKQVSAKTQEQINKFEQGRKSAFDEAQKYMAASGELESKNHKLEDQVQQVSKQKQELMQAYQQLSEQNTGLMEKFEFLTSDPSKGRMEQAVARLTEENHMMSDKIKQLAADKERMQAGAMHETSISKESAAAAAAAAQSIANLAADNHKLEQQVAQVSKEKAAMQAKYAESISAYKFKQDNFDANLKESIAKVKAVTGAQLEKEKQDLARAYHERDEWIKGATALQAEKNRLLATIQQLTTEKDGLKKERLLAESSYKSAAEQMLKQLDGLA